MAAAAYLGVPTTIWKTRGESLEDCLDLAMPMTCDRKSPLDSTLPANTSRICSSTVPSPSFDAINSLISLTTSPAGTLNLRHVVETDEHVSCFMLINGALSTLDGRLDAYACTLKKIDRSLVRQAERYRIIGSNEAAPCSNFQR